MKSFTPTVLAFAAATFTLASAIPTNLKSRTEGVEITLKGATDDPADQYSVWVPFRSWTYTYNALSISRVEYDHYSAYCDFHGVDEATAPPVEANGQLGPPQTITSIYCDDKSISYTYGGKRSEPALEKRDYISIILRGATDDINDRYYITVSDDGSETYTGQDLGISLAEYDFLSYDCQFNGIDSIAIPANPVPDTYYGPWIQLGPPQEIVSVQCHPR